MSRERKPRVWVLEDDADCAFVMDRILSPLYELSSFAKLAEFANAIETADCPDVVVVDLCLLDGQFLTWVGSGAGASLIRGVPFVVVSSMDDADIIRDCFDKGARDYMTKPFGKAELLFKLERILSGFSDDPRAKIELDPFRRRARLFGAESSDLTPREFQILLLLMTSPGFTANKQAMIAKVWDGVYVQSKTLDVHLVHLRQKLRPMRLRIEFVFPARYRLVYLGPNVTRSGAETLDSESLPEDPGFSNSQTAPRLEEAFRTPGR